MTVVIFVNFFYIAAASLIAKFPQENLLVTDIVIVPDLCPLKLCPKAKLTRWSKQSCAA